MPDLRFLPASLAAFAVCASSATAQSPAELAGAWQGSLVLPGGQSDIILKIDEQGRALLDNPGQGMRDIPVEGPTIAEGLVRFSVPSLGGRFEGRLSQDRRTMTGTLNAGPISLPLVLTLSPRAE